MYNNYDQINNDPFDENSELDRMARNMNKNKNRTRDETMDDYPNKYSRLQNGVKFLEQNYPSFIPTNQNSNYSNGFFSVQGNYSDIDIQQKNNFVDLYENETDNDSVFSYSDASSIIDLISSEGVSKVSSKIKKKLKSKNNHLKDLENDDSFIDHIRTCEQCKKKIFELIIDNNKKDDKILKLLHDKTKELNIETKSNNLTDINTINNINNDENHSILKSTSVKDTIIIIIVGIFIIIILDLVLG